MANARMAHVWKYWLTAGLLTTAGMSFLSDDSLLAFAIYEVIGFATAAALIIGARVHRPAKPMIWYLFAAGHVLWCLGDMAYGVSTYVLGKREFPALFDYFYLAAIPVMGAGLFVLIRGRASRRDRAGLLDAGIIATGLSLVVWTFIMRPTITDDTMTILQRLVSLAYPIGDVLLLAMVARLLLTPGARTASYRLVVSALLLNLLSDISYCYMTVTGVYSSSVKDVGWLLAYLAWGAAALHPSMRSLSETAPDQPARFNGRRLALLTATSLLAPLIQAYQGLTNPKNVDWPAASIGAIVLFLLVVARMSGLMSQIQDQAAQLDALAHNDALTGVPNRRAWDLELARHLANARRSGADVVVALLDLDHFKHFNDRYGHQAGDRLLKEAAAAWRDQVRKGDLLARYGGEEFAMCITGMSTTEAADMLTRVLAATPLGQTFSCGIAAWTGEEAPERLVARADEALYQAKHTGRNRVVVHTNELTGAPSRPTVDESVSIS